MYALTSTLANAIGIIVKGISKMSILTFGRRYQNLSSELLVTNSILSLAFSKGTSISHLKLQKLLYFVYKKYLQDINQPLFSEYFEVWTLGPVLPSVYHIFKKYGSRDIDDYAYATLDLGRMKLVVSQSDIAFYNALNWVWTVYGYYDASELVELTHKTDTAWSIADRNESAYLDDQDIMREQWYL
ncbi:MAG: DUF4065 domain-containing protein [Defluviitaleaceae bacterium]|nr:DUF4065 domain-containing protein [Defluviitaleaceae bacterium]